MLIHAEPSHCMSDVLSRNDYEGPISLAVQLADVMSSWRAQRADTGPSATSLRTAMRATSSPSPTELSIKTRYNPGLSRRNPQTAARTVNKIARHYGERRWPRQDDALSCVSTCTARSLT